MTSIKKVWSVEWLVGQHGTLSNQQAREWIKGTATIHRTRARLVLETSRKTHVQVIPISKKLKVSYNDPLARNFMINLETLHQEVILAVFNESDGKSLVEGLDKSGARVLVTSQEISAEIRDKDMGSFVDLRENQVWRSTSGSGEWKERMTPRLSRKTSENRTIWYCDEEEVVDEDTENGNISERLNEDLNSSDDFRSFESLDGAKHSKSTSTLPRASKQSSTLSKNKRFSLSSSTLSRASKHSSSTSRLPDVEKHSSALHKVNQHSFSTSTLPKATKHSLSISRSAKYSVSSSTLPRSSKKPSTKEHGSSAALDKFLFLLPDQNSEDEFEPEKFGLFSDPGVIRFEFDDYPDTVLEIPKEMLEEEEGIGIGSEWMRTSYEDLNLDIAKTVKFEEGLQVSPHSTSMYSKVVSKSAGNICSLEDSTIPEESSYSESYEKLSIHNWNLPEPETPCNQFLVDEVDGEFSDTDTNTDSDGYVEDSYC